MVGRGDSAETGVKVIVIDRIDIGVLPEPAEYLQASG